ncbi:alpha/beta fold hydrolase [Aquicoccus porphyridii]|uniref:Alpha/beta fold hydrolase n=1 Tax=Aquicoccus porphyridii TaxID=1852029 RepID=A0A5A9ZHS8_9RHOB|nr:alpha/beta fold hydrolase [Aquicoccus porphyridii]KAA0916804.1 alpha/beta fold hydrolase [Aquicoccus porphyridii]RAI53924.1 alpha/beta hydrolase [Rhodobacteraceae bacterium AsT-22]
MKITANDITLEIEDHGPADAPAMILVRGLGTQLVHWPENLVQGFVNSGFRTISFDNRDVGRSQRCPAPGVPGDADEITAKIMAGTDIPPAYTLDDMARDVIGLMDARGIERAHVFGISMGGAITQLLALDHGDRLLSATIVMTAARPLLERGRIADMLPRLLARPETLDEAQDNWVAGHASFGSPGFPMAEEDIRAEARLAWSRGADAEGVNRQLLATLDAPDRRPRLGGVTTPCLVIHGTDDTLIPVEMGAEIADHIPGSEFHPIKGMGHIITPLLAPQIVSLVGDFIRRRG